MSRSGIGERRGWRPPRSRNTVGVIALAVAAPWTGWAVVRLLGIEDGHPLLPAMAFTPYVAATAWVPVVAASALRRWWVAGLAGLAMLALALAVAPRALHRPQEPLPGGTTLSVMSANLLRGHGDVAAVMSLARKHDIDVLSLQEMTADAVLRLDRAGAQERFPYRVLDARTGVHGSGLMSRYPLRDAHQPRTPLAMPEAQLAVPGVEGTILVKAIHVVTPLHDDIPLWRDEFRALPGATPDGQLHLLIGDFNATLDHDELRSLIATGYHDAADTTGNGLHGTYRHGSRLPVTIAIDHVLVDRRAHITATSIHPIPRSDHRALIATISLPAR